MGGKNKNSNIENASEEGNLVWTPIMNEALVDAFLHQHNLGNWVNGSFTTKAYENIVNELKEKLGKDVDKDKNPVTKLWNAEPEVWDALIKVEVWNMLEDLGLNSNQITSTYLHLLEHPDKLRAVLGCPPRRRLDIVMRVVFDT
ncbi:hypothetical protein SLE2022_231580 [Rubroshorea leprosula]